MHVESTAKPLVLGYRHTHTHTHTQPFNGLWSGTTRVDRYQKKHSPTHTHPDHRTSFINFFHLQRFIASSLFSLRAIDVLVLIYVSANRSSQRLVGLSYLFGCLFIRLPLLAIFQ